MNNFVNYLVGKEDFYIQKSQILTKQDFINIIGSDPIKNWDLYTDREKSIINYILLNIVGTNKVFQQGTYTFNNTALTQSNYNYDNSIKLIKIPVHMILQYSFVQSNFFL